MVRPSVFLLLLALPAIAAPITLDISNPHDYANISYSFPFETPIAGYTYRGSMSFAWNVPQSALAGIDATEVPLYITLSSPEGGPVTFLGSLIPGHSTQVALLCRARDAKCSNESHLLESVVVMFSPRAESDSGAISVNVSTSPPPGAADMVYGAATGVLSSALNATRENGTATRAADSSPAKSGGALGILAFASKNLILMLLLLVLAVILLWFRFARGRN